MPRDRAQMPYGPPGLGLILMPSVVMCKHGVRSTSGLRGVGEWQLPLDGPKLPRGLLLNTLATLERLLSSDKRLLVLLPFQIEPSSTTFTSIQYATTQ